ncbi:biotin transporter BioY [Peribacillus sp. NPDC096379]|uniref:biotin transporter BioY n=1 Tax=Peribacillus sp. NPDC096379 TaxID=3364393 RepID=UPI0038030C2C
MKLKDLMYVSMFVAIMGVLGVLPPILFAFTPVPITLQTLGIMLSGSVLGARLGPKYAALSQILFLLLVMTGLPLLSGGRGGIGVFFSPSGGYLIGWVAGAYVIGLLSYRMKNVSLVKILLINIIGGIGVVYLFGIPIQALMMNIGIDKTMILSLVYLPGDSIKVVVASLIAIKLRNYIPLAKRVQV